MSHAGLSPEQKAQFDRDGYIILRGVLSRDECDRVVAHMMDLHDGRKKLEGYQPRKPDDWSRTHHQHLYDPVAMDLLIHPKLRAPLRDCFGGDEPEGVQTMYFYKGSEQHRHQDHYYIPQCVSAWMAMTDVNEDNGTIWVQPGSHKGKLIRYGEQRDDKGQPMPLFGKHYDDALDAMVEANGVPEVPVIASAGDVVFFHGVLIHRGGPLRRPGSFRHVIANHYIPRSSTEWTHSTLPRFDFDGNRRITGARAAG